jgi:FMN-dependent oxidoreductase (nitrilotriacetate monooxygenase family)
MSSRKMHLVAYLKTGPTVAHAGGWRHPEATIDDIFDPNRYAQMAKMLEAARFDGCFFADFFGVAENYGDGFETYLRVGGQNSYLDPLSVLPIMAMATRHLGLGATISTSFLTPYQIARSLASVDLLSGGRAAWNVVTSTTNTEARNAGLDEIPPHDLRYDRADEVLEACMALWHSWEPDAMVLDKQRGVFVDPSKVHYANYEGKFVKTRGPLPSPPSPQGHPVIMQAGASDRGRDFAARWAEVIFTPAYDKATMREFYNDMQARMGAAGRPPGSCKILPGITPIVGETAQIARERAEQFDLLQDSEYDLAYSSMSLGADLRKHKTMAEAKAARGNQGIHSAGADLEKLEQRTNLSTQQLGANRRKDEAVVGTPTMIADTMQDLFESGACDGFIIRPVISPLSYEQFCRAVVPELQRRQTFRTEYAATTLRGNLLN